MKQEYHHFSEYAELGYKGLLSPPERVSTPWWPKFNELTGGLRPNEYTILCGSTGAGKTAFVSSLVERAATAGAGCYVASVETGPIDFFRRLVSARAKKNWNQGDVVPLEQVQNFAARNGSFPELPIYIATYEDRVDNRKMMTQVKHSIDNEGVKLVILDNLNFFMEVTTQSNQVVEMDRVVHDWIIFSKQNKAHVVMIMHPKKTETGRVLSEFDIKGSSTAVQEAHNVFLFNRPAKEGHEKIRESGQDPGVVRELTIAKCRRIGRGVGKTILFKSEDEGASYDEYIYERGPAANPVPSRKYANDQRQDGVPETPWWDR